MISPKLFSHPKRVNVQKNAAIHRRHVQAVDLLMLPIQNKYYLDKIVDRLKIELFIDKLNNDSVVY